MTNSGSSANLLAVASLFHVKDNPLNRGDEVIVPAIAWSTTYAPLHQHGLRFRVVDVELDTLNMDAGQLEAALTPLSRAVVGVSILGIQLPWTRYAPSPIATDSISWRITANPWVAI